MWNHNSIHTIDQTVDQNRDQINAIKMNPQMRQFAANIEEMDKKHILKTNTISFGLGFLFVLVLYGLVVNEQIRLSGPFLPMFLMLFHQRLEYVLRYQALAVSPIAINALLVLMRKFSLPDDINDDLYERLNRPLKDSIHEFVMSTTIQMVLTANLNAEQVMLFCPFLAITFFIGRIVYLATYPNYHYFGTALSFAPTLIAILFNAYGAIRFIFA